MSSSLDLDKNGVWYGWEAKNGQVQGQGNLSLDADRLKIIYAEAAESLGVEINEITQRVNAGEKVVWEKQIG